MDGVQVSIDRIVVDFTDIFWDFFNSFQLRLRHYFNATFHLKEKGFKYHLHVRDLGHYLHISYQLTFVPKARKDTLRIECDPDSLVHFYSWLKPLKDYARAILFVRCDVAFDIPFPLSELFTLSLTGRNMHTWKASIRYAGEFYDAEVGLYYLRARYYDPYIGQFISEDTYEGKANDPLSLNRYTYAHNNPLLYVDPTGHKVE